MQIDQDIRVQGNQLKQNQSQTFWYLWRVKEQTPTGGWVITQKLEDLEINVNMGGVTYRYNSKIGNNPNDPRTDLFDGMVGAEFKFVLDKAFQVVEVKGGTELTRKLIRKVGDANPSTVPLIRSLLNEDNLKQSASSTFGFLPQTPVNVGSTWTLTNFLNMGSLGKYKSTQKFTYQGQQKDRDVIHSKISLEYSSPNNDQGQLGFKIQKGDLKGHGTGKILFDNNNGLLDRTQQTLYLNGQLVIEVGGQQHTVDLSQTQQTTANITPVTNMGKGGNLPRETSRE